MPQQDYKPFGIEKNVSESGRTSNFQIHDEFGFTSVKCHWYEEKKRLYIFVPSLTGFFELAGYINMNGKEN